MLVLSRKLDEEIVLLNLGVTIKVMAIRKGTVRIGIDAPEEVKVLRKELIDGDGVGSERHGER
jgi:carbon storage regulator CsrA